MKLCAFLLALASVTAAADRPHILWYKQPAAQWTEALPIGNGRLAAMVFGKTDDERIRIRCGLARGRTATIPRRQRRFPK